MKKTLIVGAIAAITVLAGGWALAQSAGHGPMGFGPPFMRGQGPDGMGPGMMKGMRHGMGPGMMQGMGPGMMHGRAGVGLADPAQLERLKTELEITPAQEQAWSKYAKAVQEAAAAMKTTRESVDPDAVSKMTPADRYAFVSKMREQGQKQFGAVETAADELLATLDATQKAKATEILPGLAFGPPMRGAFAGDEQHKH
jgi:LTXXQ motif family protein